MTESVALAWLRGLASRGIVVSLRGKRLSVSKEAYRQLTAQELATWRDCRREIQSLVARGVSVGVQTNPLHAGDYQTSTPAPVLDPPCRWCHQSPCISETHPYYFDLHPLARQARDDAFATMQMHTALRRQAERHD